MTYDADRRLLTATAPAPFKSGAALIRTSNTYDPDGHVLSVTRTNGASNAVTSMSYTATGKLQSATDPNGNVTTNSYDADDRLISVTDPLLRQTVYGYDAMSRRISVSNPAIQASPLLQQSYTPDGLIASLTDANNNTTSFTPDGFDRLSTTSYPDGSTENLTYDSDSNVLTRQTRAGPTIAFTYDTLNRLSAKAPPSEPTVSYAYDLASHLIGIGDNSSAIARPAASASYATALAYDQLNRPLAVSWRPAPAQAAPTAATASFAFGYDATNRRIGQSATDKSWWSFPAAAMNVGYAANSLNQYSAVGAVTPSYDGNGNLTSDGTFTYRYDAENRLISASGTGLAASYTYDAQGRRKSKTVNGTTTIYVTDADNREVLEYNGSSGAIGNWYTFAPARAFGPDAVLNQMNVAAATRATLIPDSQGSIVASLDASSGALTKFGYQTYGENPSLTAGSFQYTARRFDPETAGSTAQPSGLYYYRSRMYSPAWGRFPQPDAVGMKLLLAAATAGQPSAQTTQPPSITGAAPNVLPGLGATIGSTGSNVPSAFWYVAAENLYGYVGNDPINNIDPIGEDTLQIGIAGNINLPFGLSIPLGYGVAIDTSGNIETYSYAGGGVQLGANVGAGLSIQVSNAQTVYDLTGKFENASAYGGVGLGGSADVFYGISANGPVVGGGVTLGTALGASVSGGVTNTWIGQPTK